MKIALYLRVSTNVQETERQRTDLTKRAKKDKAEIAYIFEDKISGFKNEKRRPDLNKLLQLTKEDIDSVYITELSRLSRDPAHFTELVDIFKQKGINIFFLAQNINTINNDNDLDFTTDISLAFFSRYSAYEIKLKNDRSASGKREAIRRGNSYSYKPPFGYKKVDKQLCLHDDEAKIVKDIFTKYANGESIKEIVENLNLRQIPTRNSDFIKKESFQVNNKKTINKSEIKWGKSSVRNLLRNTVYCGHKVIKSGDEIKTPAIITSELFAKCQDEIKGRISNTDKSLKNDFMLRGIFICGECGKQFLGTRSHSNLLYKCSDKTHLKSNSYIGCKNTSIFKVHIEEMIWAAVKSAYIMLKTKQIKEGNISTIKIKIEEFNSDIKAIDIKLNDLAENSSRLLDLYTKGLYPLITLENKQNILNSEIHSFSKKKKKLQVLINDAICSLQAIDEMDSKPFNLEEVEKVYDLRKEAVRELLKEVLIFKIDNKFTVFQLNFKAGYTQNIIRETWRKKYQIVDSYNLTFDPNTKLFQNNNQIEKNGSNDFELSSISNHYTSEDLFHSYSKYPEFLDLGLS
ncbi:MAG TPA: recombinase family protein [Prolixibacteraceae bacterium]|jgi:DNA invertase Pin-like site-specific DNA recombinase